MERFGLLVEVLPGKTGLVHLSELDVDRAVGPAAFSIRALEIGAASSCLTILPRTEWGYNA